MSQLFQNLTSYSQENYYPFHMPGHKRKMEAYSKEALYHLDITEIDGFDNLHEPEGILLEAQIRAAKLYESEATFYLINGSTSGILSSISTTVSMGGKLLMGRNSHKAAYNAIMLRQLEVEYLYPQVIEKYNVFGGINPQEVEQALNRDSSIEAVFITSPTADGVVSDVAKIVDICHEYQKPLIVDEAHGAHFAFGSIFSGTSIKKGADIVIHSVHKTLPAFTQTALIHCNGKLVPKEKLKEFLAIYQTSSPSYILMAGIDQCISILSKDREELFHYLENNIEQFRENCKDLKNIQIMDETIIGKHNVFDLDLSKLLISVYNAKLTGQQLYELLLHHYHLQMEMAAGSYVLGISTIMDTKEGFDRLSKALFSIDQELEKQKEPIQRLEIEKYDKQPQDATIREVVFTIYEASIKEKQLCEINKAEGKICGDFIVVYPPGLPMIVPGEKITRDIIVQLQNYQKQGLNILGMKEMQIRIVSNSIQAQ